MTLHPGQRVRLVALVGWTSVDQVLFTLSNLVVTLAMARGGGAEGLGAFSVALAAHFLVLGCVRSLVTEPLLARPPGGDERRAEAAAVTLTVLGACAGALVVGVPGLLLGRPELVVMAAALPITLLQDTLRYVAFRRGRPDRAALLDGGWLLGSVVAWPVVVASGSPATAMACWAGGAAVGTAAAWRALRPRFAPAGDARDWWRREASGLARPLIADTFVFVAYQQAVVLVVVALVGDGGMGTLRAGEIYFGPLALALTALGVLLVPRLARRPAVLTTRAVLVGSAALASIVALACLAVVAAEPVLRTVLYGGAIGVPTAVLVPLACWPVLIAASTGMVIAAKVHGRGRDIARSRLSGAVVGLALLPIGALAWGLPGAAWSIVASGTVFTAELTVRTIRHTAPARGPV